VPGTLAGALRFKSLNFWLGIILDPGVSFVALRKIFTEREGFGFQSLASCKLLPARRRAPGAYVPSVRLPIGMDLLHHHSVVRVILALAQVVKAYALAFNQECCASNPSVF
jgi:hypothetical protein